MECYCTCIIEILRYFFILQSLTTSEMRLSQSHKAKNCWTENWWSSGIMSNFLGEFFFMFWGSKKNFVPQIIKKWPQKLLIIPLDQQFYMLFKIFSSLKLSNFAEWKNNLDLLWSRYKSIPLHSTQLPILRLELYNVLSSYLH